MIKYTHEYIPKEVTHYNKDIVAIIDNSYTSKEVDTVKKNIVFVIDEICDTENIDKLDLKIFYTDNVGKLWQAYDVKNNTHVILDCQTLSDALRKHLEDE